MDRVSWRFTWYYALSQFKLKYRYTALGFLWNFLEPALYLAVLSLVFSAVNRMEIDDYAVFLFSALVPWRYFEKVVNSCLESIAGGDWLLKKMFVSPLSLPVARWINASFEFGFALAIVLATVALLGRRWEPTLLVLPLAVVPWLGFSLGAGLIAAVLFTFFRDLRPVIQMSLMLLFFSSPILFKPDFFAAGSPQAAMLRWHPITYFAALFQKPIYYGVMPDRVDWLAATGIAAGSLLLGIHLMRRARRRLYFYL